MLSGRSKGIEPLRLPTFIDNFLIEETPERGWWPTNVYWKNTIYSMRLFEDRNVAKLNSIICNVMKPINIRPAGLRHIYDQNVVERRRAERSPAMRHKHVNMIKISLHYSPKPSCECGNMTKTSLLYLLKQNTQRGIAQFGHMTEMSLS